MAVKYFFPDLNITLTEKQFEEMKKLCELIPALPGRVFERRARRIARLTRARAYAVCREIREGNYVRIITWYKVLAVLTTVYHGAKSRHLEARMLLDCPEFEYGKRQFEDFCRWCLERFFELNGYDDYIAHAKAYFGIERVDEFENKEDREAELWIEIYDYDRGYYPFECEMKLPAYYWTDYTYAKREFDRQARERTIHDTYNTYSPLERLVCEHFGYDEERWLE